LKGVWVPHDTRDAIVDFVRRWSDQTGLVVASFLRWIGIATSKWHSWKVRYGKANEHNAGIPRDHWLEPGEKKAIIDWFFRGKVRASDFPGAFPAGSPWLLSLGRCGSAADTGRLASPCCQGRPWPQSPSTSICPPA
jgi:hypothetical protein